jgi:hypothetical protein
MIHKKTIYSMTCNKCHTTLKYEKDSIMRAHAGEPIYEDNLENIQEVAKDMGWSVEPDLCVECDFILSKL